MERLKTMAIAALLAALAVLTACGGGEPEYLSWQWCYDKSYEANVAERNGETYSARDYWLDRYGLDAQLRCNAEAPGAIPDGRRAALCETATRTQRIIWEC